MPGTGFNLPVIDISCIGLDKEDPLDYSSKDVTSTARQLCDAFKNVGFVYIKNHGITDELVCIKEDYSTWMNRITPGNGGRGYNVDTLSLTWVSSLKRYLKRIENDQKACKNVWNRC